MRKPVIIISAAGLAFTCTHHPCSRIDVIKEERPPPRRPKASATETGSTHIPFCSTAAARCANGTAVGGGGNFVASVLLQWQVESLGFLSASTTHLTSILPS